jgi:hypothetical protein
VSAHPDIARTATGIGDTNFETMSVIANAEVAFAARDIPIILTLNSCRAVNVKRALGIVRIDADAAGGAN